MRHSPSQIIQWVGDLPAHGLDQLRVERRWLSHETTCNKQPGERPEREPRGIAIDLSGPHIGMADELLPRAYLDITQDKVCCKMGAYLHSDDLC